MSAQTSLEEHKMNNVIFSIGKIQAVRKRSDLLQKCVHKGKKVIGEFLKFRIARRKGLKDSRKERKY